MANYSCREKADMVFMYGRANGNGREAARLYQEAYPNRQQPSHKLFASLFHRLAETGTVSTPLPGRGRPRRARTVEVEEVILEAVGENPNVSTRQLARQLNTNQMTTWRVLHEQLLHPYHLQRVQTLTPADFPMRENFCRWFIQQTADPRFISSLLVTDEATFTRNGVHNCHNEHQWADDNPHALFEGRHQVNFRINVWAGIIGDYLIGPYIFPQRLSGDVYYNFLVDTLPQLLEDVPLETRANLWYMHDGAPPSFPSSCT